MAIISGLISSLSLTVIIIISIVVYVNTDRIKKYNTESINELVDQINDSQYYAYSFDKKQEQNIKNLDSNLKLLNKQFVKKDDIQSRGVDIVKTGKVQLGDQYLLSGVGDAHSGGKPDGWLRVMDKDGKDYAGGVATGKLWTRDGAELNGNVNATGNLNVQGRLHFKDPSFDVKGNGANSTDSYFLEKKVDAHNVSSLRLTLNDDNDESLQVWGGSCATGNCGGQGEMKHRFGADGNSWHREWVDAQNVQGRDHVRAGNWAAWMRNSGDIHASNRLGVGISPDAQGAFKMFVDGGQKGQWSSLVRHGPTHVYMGHEAGYGMHINTQRAGGEYALQIYSANGELMNVGNDGGVRIGRGDGQGYTHIRSKNVHIGDNYNGDVGASLYLGGTVGDNAWDHTVIESRKWGSPEKSELLLFKGNDPIGGCNGACGPDRIRLRAAEIDFDVFPGYTTNRNAENVVAKVTQDRIIAPKLQLGDKFLMSGVGDAHGNDGWLRLFDKDNKGYYGGLAAGALWTGAGGIVQGSDERMKKDIQAVSKEDITNLQKIAPKKYVMKDNDKPDYGFIAQEVEKVYPDLVSEGPNKMKAVNYNGFVPLVVGSVNEMRKTIPDDKRICIGDTCLTEEDIIKIKKMK